MNVLFVCGRARQRSPTAEELFGGLGNIRAIAAGVSADADSPLTRDLVEWANLIFVMEAAHRSKLSRLFGSALRDKPVVCLNIADHYALNDPRLIKMLWQRVPRSLPTVLPFRPS